METIVGAKPLINSAGDEIKVADLSAEPKFIGIYFGAHWAPPCRKFTTKLAEVYEELNKGGKNFEVVFCSSDGNEDHFKENLAGMPWTALQFTEN